MRSSTLTHNNAPSRLLRNFDLSKAWRRVIVVAFAVWSVAQAQTNTPVLPQSRPLVLDEVRYRLRAGGRIAIDAPAESVDFVRAAKTRTITLGGVPAHGFVFGLSGRGDQLVLAVSLRAKPGEYAISISASRDQGDMRTAALNITLDPMEPVPSNSTVPPVVLLNGLQLPSTLTEFLTLDTCPVSTTSPPSAQTFGSLQAQLLTSQSLGGPGAPVVYFFDNCVEDKNDYVENLGNALADVLNLIKYDNGTLVPQVDLISHSMGGLIVRAYLSGLQTNGTLSPPINPRVRKFIEIATPNFGSFYAAEADATLLGLFISLGSQIQEMIPGSSLLWNLARWNQGSDDLRGVDALALVGNGATWTGLSGTSLANAGDGVVSLTSASLGFARDPSRTRVLPYCHTDLFCSAGIANVDESPETGEIVLSFLENNSAWQSYGTSQQGNFYLSQYGGLYLAYESAALQWATDLKQVTFANAPLQNGEASGENYYAEFVEGITGALQFESQSLGTFGCGSITEAVGYYSAVRCKAGPIISSVGPLVSGASGLVVAGGGAITLNGVGFGQQCSTCGVWSYPGPVALPVSSWTGSAITTRLPASTGFLQLLTQTASGSDIINVIAQAPPIISLSPAQLQFSYTLGAAAPTSQSVTVSNSGGGTFTWSSTPSVSWLTLSSAPGLLTVGINPAGVSPGTYSGVITVTATGASNSPQTVSVSLAVAPNPSALVVSSQALSFTYLVGGAVPAAQSISITNAASGTLSWTASSSATWLTVSPTFGSIPSTISVSVNPTGLSAGSSAGVVTVSSPGIASQKITVTLTISSATPTGPQISAGGILNAATFLDGGIAPNEFISIVGTGLGPATGASSTMTTLLSGTRIYIGGTPAFLTYAQNGQVNALVPFGVAGTGSTTIQAEFKGVAGNTVTVPVVDSAPGVFTQAYGPGQAWLANADGTFNSSANAAPRNTYVAFWATGQGLLNVSLQDGMQPTGPPYPNPLLPVTVTIGGAVVPAANVVFTGLVYSGEIQINVLIPETASTGGAIPLVLTIGGASSRTDVTIAVE